MKTITTSLSEVDQLKSQIEFLKGKLQIEQKSTRMLKGFISDHNLGQELYHYQKLVCVDPAKKFLPVHSCLARPWQSVENLN